MGGNWLLEVSCVEAESPLDLRARAWVADTGPTNNTMRFPVEDSQVDDLKSWIREGDARRAFRFRVKTLEQRREVLPENAASDRQCAICYDLPANTMALPCRHSSICEECL